jgi:HEAT repeat protein
MGEMPDPAFAPTLIRLLDDQQAVRRAALQSLPKVVGRDVAAPQGQTADDLSQRIELWKRWYQGERSARRD